MTQKSSAKNFTRGGQITFHNLRMLLQINKAVGQFYGASLLLLTGCIFYVLTPMDNFHALFYLANAKLSVTLGDNDSIYKIPYHGKTISLTAEQIVNAAYFKNILNHTWHNLIISGVGGLIASIIGAFFMVRFLFKQGEEQTTNQFVRGAVFAEPKKIIKQMKRDNAVSDLNIDGFPLVKDSEVQHLLVHGTIGTGKSQLIMKILDGLKQRGDRVIIYDKGCSFIPKFYDEAHDIILNPFDKRCAHWDLWAEALERADFENVAESLIPMHGETDPFWVSAARTVFSSLAEKIKDDPERSMDKLLQLILTGELQSLHKYLEGTPAAMLMSEKIEKTAISVRSVITTYLKSLQTLGGLAGDDEKSFSIRDWVQEDAKGWLFISSNGEQQSTLKPLISMWLAMASITLLSLPEDRNRRIWFICDELPSLHKLPMLGETIAEVRKFGGCFLLGMQSFSQLEKVYGRGAAHEIFDLLNTRFFFRSPSSDMAQLVSRELGQEEVEDTRENYSYGANTIRDGISLGRNRLTRPIVTYPEIMNLKDMHCYVRLQGDYPVTLLNLNLEQRNKMAPGFIKRRHQIMMPPQDISNKQEPHNSSSTHNTALEALMKSKESELSDVFDESY